MRNLKKTILLSSLFFMVLQVAYGVGTIDTKGNIENKQFLQSVFKVNDVNQFVDMSLKDIAKAKQEKLGLKEKITIKLVQRKMKKHLKKNKKFSVEEIYNNTTKRFNIGGFLLGFFFSLVGVLVSILFGGNAFRSALLGFLCSLIIVGIILLAA